jgi:cellulose synthase operon protein B
MKHDLHSPTPNRQPSRRRSRPSSHRRIRPLWAFAGMLLSCGLLLGWAILPTSAQTEAPIPTEESGAPQPDLSRSEFALPDPPAAPPTVAPEAAGQYVLEFNRSPIVGNRLRMEGIYDERRLRFTRPRNWEPESVQISLRFRHSAALYATRSNLTVLVNGTSIGSVPLNKPQGEIGNVVFEVPPGVIRDYNEVVLAALQNNSPTCTQDPFDPSLWTEILPDSKLVFNFQPKAIALDFHRYPYPVFDDLSLEPNQVAYLQPSEIDETWLTATSRLHTSLGRLAEYRPLDTRIVEAIDQAAGRERLIVIGTPAIQPDLSSLDLPLSLGSGRFLDAEQQPFPSDVGLLMLTTTPDGAVPVLVATGNGAEGVAKAVQFLVQQEDRQIATGNLIVVTQIDQVETPDPRAWQGYLPLENSFKLSDLRTFDDQAYGDVTVRGSHSPSLELDFRALPDDQFSPGNTMTLRYSYGPQINPLTSLVEVELDDVVVAGKRLTSISGGNRETLKVTLPEDRIKPNSRIQVNFRLDPRERRSCSRVTDQQLWSTIHSDTEFKLNREQVVRLPDLELLRAGYPFAAPQDLSSTAIAMPENPTQADLLLLLEVSERLGRLSRAESVKLDVYRASKLPAEQRDSRHIIAIGTEAQFPLSEAFEQEDGFSLRDLFSRHWGQKQIQTLPDQEGLVKQIISPWNQDRVMLALSAQTEVGLQQVRDLLSQDNLFFQLEGDTVLIAANEPDPSPYDPNAYSLEFLQQSSQRQLASANLSSRIAAVLRGNWFVLAPGIVAASLVLYGVIQLYLKRLTGQE